MNDIEKGLINILIKLKYIDEQIDVSTDLLEDILIDSLMFITFITYIEEELQFDFEDEDILIENFKSVSIISDLIGNKYLKKKG